MPFLAYFLFVGTILMGMMAFAENTKSPLLTASTSSQILPQKAPPKNLTIRDVASKAFPSARFAKKRNLAAKHKTPTKVARSKAQNVDGNYHMRLAQENYGRVW
jgi:hypothetical protein